MEFRDVLKALRGELDIAQAGLAVSSHIHVTTISRRKSGRTLSSSAFIAGASALNLRALREDVGNAIQKRPDLPNGGLGAVEYASLRQMAEDHSLPVCICDLHDETADVRQRSTSNAK